MLIEIFTLLSFISFFLIYLGQKNGIYFIVGGISLMVTGAFTLGDNLQIRSGEAISITDHTYLDDLSITNYNYSLSNATGTPQLIQSSANSASDTNTTKTTSQNTVFAYANTPTIGSVGVHTFIGFLYILSGILTIFGAKTSASGSKL